MIDEIFVEHVSSDGSGCDLVLNGTTIQNGVRSVSIDITPHYMPILTLRIPFLSLTNIGPDMEALQKENEQLKQMIDDLNRRIAILLDT